MAAGRIGLCRSATRASSRPWIAEASDPGAAVRRRQEMTVEGGLSKPRSKAINSSLIIWLGWAGSGVRDELLVWVQDIFTARLEPLADFLAISLAGFAQRLKSLWADRSDHLADLGKQSPVNFLQRCPTAHH